MKENLVEALDVILKALEANKIQNIEVRGAIAYGYNFRSALAVVPAEDITCTEEEVPEAPVAQVVPAAQVKKIVKEEVKVKE